MEIFHLRKVRVRRLQKKAQDKIGWRYILNFAGLSPSAAFADHNRAHTVRCENCGDPFVTRGKRAKRCPSCRRGKSSTDMCPKFVEAPSTGRIVEARHYHPEIHRGNVDDVARAAAVDEILRRIGSMRARGVPAD